MGAIGGGAVAQCAQIQPARPSTWLFGEAGGIQVWTVEGDPRVQVSVLIGDGAPVVLLNECISGTAREYDALAWALKQIATGEPGFVARRV